MFRRAMSFTFLWMASLIFMFCTLSGSGAQNSAPAPANYQNTKSCDQGSPGTGFNIGQYRYKLTSEIFQPTMDLHQKIQNIYGNNAEIVDWDTIKSLLHEFAIRREFIKEVGIPLQGYNFSCGNVLIFKSGGNNINGLHYLLARHDGLRPNDWLILDTIGQNELHLGRWNHYGRVLIRIKERDLVEPEVTINTQNPALGTAQTPAFEAPAAPLSTSLPRRRIALIIANSNYHSEAPLQNPPNDATLLASSLKLAGFQSVTVKHDLTREQMSQAIKDFAYLADVADWAVVYYSGHGIEYNGMNYMIPIDARLKVDRDIELEAVEVNTVLSSLEGAKKLRLLILDSCRSNPFIRGMRRAISSRSIGRGLAPIEPEAGTLVVYAAKAGQEALDGTGRNSPFAQALAKRMQTPNLEIRRLFDLVRDDVMAATDKKQQPFSYGSLSGSEDFYFLRR